MNRVHLGSCLRWCDDVEQVRASYLNRGCTQSLYINTDTFGVFATHNGLSWEIFVRRGSWMPVLQQFLTAELLPDHRFTA